MFGYKKLKREVKDLRRRVAFLEDIMGKPYIILNQPLKDFPPPSNGTLQVHYSPPCPRCGKDDHWPFGDAPCPSR